ncbi:MAG: hypothetical protein RIC56_23620 [Pseudomonadales bacterium]
MKLATFLIVGLFVGAVQAAEYPNMEGTWSGSVRTVSSGEEVQSQVARGGAVIQRVDLTFMVSYQDGEVFTGETRSSAANAVPLSVWGAIRSTGREAVFVTGNGGRGQLWFSSPTEFEYCYANQTQEQMSAYCAVLQKQP